MLLKSASPGPYFNVMIAKFELVNLQVILSYLSIHTSRILFAKEDHSLYVSLSI